jgi:DNA-directed RNA polymerase subunit RPC12/RpoP
MVDCPQCDKELEIDLDLDDWDRLGEEHTCPYCKAKLVVGQGSYVSIVDGTEENYVTLEIR